MTTTTHPDLMDTAQAAAYLHQSPGTLANWRSTKFRRVPHLKLGSRVFYRRSDLDRWMESQIVDPLPPAETVGQ